MAYNWDKMVKLTIPDGMMGWHNTGYVVINGRKVEFAVGKETEVPEPVAENIYQLMSHYSVITATAVNNGGSEYRGNSPDHNTHYVIAESNGDTTYAVKGKAYEIVSEISPSTTGKHSLKLDVPAKNLLDGYKFAEYAADNIEGAVFDKEAKTLYYQSPKVKGFVYKLPYVKPLTRYTVLFRAADGNRASSANMKLLHTDGSAEGGSIAFNQRGWGSSVSTKGKTLSGVTGFNSSGHTTLDVEKIGIFEGVVDEGSFEPYNPRRVVNAYFPRTVYGGTYNWTTGVLTVTHDLDSDSQTVVALEAPITYKLAPQEIVLEDGTNYIICDADKTVLKYVTDSTKYINEKLAAVALL